MLLEKELNELASCRDKLEWRNESVSSSSVGWQVLHSLKVVNSIIAALHKSDPARYEKKLNLSWMYIRVFRTIPRGMGKAPTLVRPVVEDIRPEEVDRLLAEVREGIRSLDALPRNAYFRHQYFGKLNLRQACLFLEVHTRHHLKIIRDILSS